MFKLHFLIWLGKHIHDLKFKLNKRQMHWEVKPLCPDQTAQFTVDKPAQWPAGKRPFRWCSLFRQANIWLYLVWLIFWDMVPLCDQSYFQTPSPLPPAPISTIPGIVGTYHCVHLYFCYSCSSEPRFSPLIAYVKCRWVSSAGRVLVAKPGTPHDRRRDLCLPC